MSDDVPNLYLTFGIDPERPWDEADFKRRFEDAKTEWSRNLNQIGKKGEEAKRFHPFLSRLWTAASNEAVRTAHQAAAVAEGHAERRRRTTELTELLDLWLQKDYLLETEAAQARAEYRDVLAGDADLRARLDEADIRTAVRTDVEVPGAGGPQERQLLPLLRALDAKNVYVVLAEADPNLTVLSPREQLVAAADTLDKRMHSIANKQQDPKIAKKQQVASLAKLMFATDEGRARHDEWMTFAPVREIFDWFGTAMKAAGEARAPQVRAVLERAVKAGAQIEEATYLLMSVFRERKLPLQLPGEEFTQALSRQIWCPWCETLNESSAAVCRRCTESLRVPCPRCGQVDPRHGGACACGFPIGRRRTVREHLARGTEALRQLDFAVADVELAAAAAIWRLPETSDDELAVGIRAERNRLEQTRAGLAAARDSIERLMGERRYVEAATRLRGASTGLPQREDMEARANAAIRAGEAALRRAKEPGLTRAERAALLTDALRLCDDLEQARVELQQIEPEPASGVTARVDKHAPEAGVLVQWTPSPDPDVSHVVVRAVGGGSPVSVENLPGQAVIKSPRRSTSLRDTGTAGLAGEPLRYAVFAERRGTWSAPAVSELVVVPGEASGVHCRAEDGRVVLTWLTPERAARVEISRAEPGSPAAATVLHLAEPGRLVDTAVRNGTRYQYRLRVLYVMPDGRKVWSAGVTSFATPLQRPAPPGPLTVNVVKTVGGFMSRHHTRVRWPAHEAGLVRVLREAGAGSLHEGDELPADAVDSHTRVVLEGQSMADDYWVDDELRQLSYFPVLVIDGTAYVGSPRRFAVADEVTGVRAEFVGVGVHVGWIWPDDATAAIVGYSVGDIPIDPTAAADQFVVDRSGAERFGGCLLSVASNSVHLNVGRVIARDGTDFVTSGVATSVARPSARVVYEVREHRRRRELVLQADRPIEVPTLTLVGHPDRTPHTRDDGETVHLVPSRRLSGGPAVVPLLRSGQPLRHRLFGAGVPPVELVDREAIPT